MRKNYVHHTTIRKILRAKGFVAGKWEGEKEKVFVGRLMLQQMGDCVLVTDLEYKTYIGDTWFQTAIKNTLIEANPDYRFIQEDLPNQILVAL